MKKAVAFISILLSLIGICSVFLVPLELWQLKGFVATVDLYNLEINNKHFENVNVFNLFIYVLWLLGALFYWCSKFREVRLLRFIFAFIFMFKLIALPMRVYGTYVFLNAPPNEKNTFEYIYPLIAVYFIYQLFFLFYSYRTLLFLKKYKPLQWTEKITEQSVYNAPIIANRWQRFLNFTIDSVIWYLLYLSHYELFRRFVLINENIVLWDHNQGIHYLPLAIIIGSRWMYYTLFELIFRATPAKLLSETTVLSNDGSKASTSQIIYRNLIRMIPLNALSFLFGFDFHDKQSKTNDYKELRTGASGVRYLLLIPLLTLICLSLYSCIKRYDESQETAWKEVLFQERHNSIVNRLNSISTNDLIVLNTYTSTNIKKCVLKVQRVRGNQIDCTYDKIEFNSTSDREILERYSAFESYKCGSNRITFQKSDLQKAILSHYDQLPTGNTMAMVSKKLEQLNLMHTNEGYFIDIILSLDQPMLHFDIALYNNEFIGLNITNYGIPSEITAIKSNDPDVKWSMDNCNLPVEIPNILRKLNRGSVHPYEVIVKGEKEALKKIDFTISIKDSLGRNLDYRVMAEEENFDPLIKEVR
jgi:uncharacterized RDD family membrane protein YckC